MPKKCKECEDHDLETKKLMTSMFSKSDIVLVLVALVMDVKVREFNIGQLPPNDIRVQAMKRDVAHIAELIGKYMISLDRKHRLAIVKSLEKQGIQLDVEHADCPHVDKHVDKKEAEA